MPDPIRRTVEELRAAGAPSFFERDPAKLKASFKAEFERLSGRTLYPSQTEMYLIEVAAYALSILHTAAQNGVVQNTAVFAEGIHLEHRGANVSTFKLLQQPAKTQLRFVLAAARPTNVVIPAGTRVGSGTAIVFATDADLTIAPGALTGTVGATALTAGATWNGLSAGAVTSILDPVAGVASASNVADVSGGTSDEDQERYRLRVVNALYKIAKGGGRRGYVEYVKEVNPDIVDVAVIKPTPGRIDIYLLMKQGEPSADLIAAVLDYLDEEELRPMGDDVYVYASTRIDHTGVLTIRVEKAIPGLKELAEQVAIDAFFPWTQELGPQIAPSVITSAVKKLAGVTDVSLAGIVWADLPEHQSARLVSMTANVVVTPNV